MRAFLVILTAVIFASCGARDYIRDGGTALIGFRFFLFAGLNGETFNAGGDAVIRPGVEFKFRVFDNMVGQHVFDFRAAPGGNTMAYPSERTAVIKKDDDLTALLIERLPLFFTPGAGMGSNSYTNGGSIWSVTTEKLMADGRPRTFRLSQGADWVVFDITEYTGLDFVFDLKDYLIYRDTSEKSFFEWLGEAYGRQ